MRCCRSDVFPTKGLASGRCRYKALVEDEEEQRLDRLLGALAARDEVQQRAEAVTRLQVSAWHCRTCGTTTERRRPACQVHAWPAPGERLVLPITSLPISR